MGTQNVTSKQLVARENASAQVVIVFSLSLTGWESDASFLDQSQSEEKQNKSNPG